MQIVEEQEIFKEAQKIFRKLNNHSMKSLDYQQEKQSVNFKFVDLIYFLDELLPNDYQERLKWALYCCSYIRHDSQYFLPLSYKWNLKGRNARICGTENSETVQEVTKRSEKFTIQRAIHEIKSTALTFFVYLPSIVQHTNHFYSNISFIRFNNHVDL